MNRDTKILIVDDFASVRTIIKGIFNRLGYETLFEADSGKSALPILKRENIGFVVTDWMMPELTGIELLRIIRQYSAASELPVLMVTAETGAEKYAEAVRAGANGIVYKPFTPDQLEQKFLELSEQMESAA